MSKNNFLRRRRSILNIDLRLFAMLVLISPLQSEIDADEVNAPHATLKGYIPANETLELKNKFDLPLQIESFTINTTNLTVDETPILLHEVFTVLDRFVVRTMNIGWGKTPVLTITPFADLADDSTTLLGLSKSHLITLSEATDQYSIVKCKPGVHVACCNPYDPTPFEKPLIIRPKFGDEYALPHMDFGSLDSSLRGDTLSTFRFRSSDERYKQTAHQTLGLHTSIPRDSDYEEHISSFIDGAYSTSPSLFHTWALAPPNTAYAVSKRTAGIATIQQSSLTLVTMIDCKRETGSLIEPVKLTLDPQSEIAFSILFHSEKSVTFDAEVLVNYRVAGGPLQSQRLKTLKALRVVCPRVEPLHKSNRQVLLDLINVEPQIGVDARSFRVERAANTGADKFDWTMLHDAIAIMMAQSDEEEIKAYTTNLIRNGCSLTRDDVVPLCSLLPETAVDVLNESYLGAVSGPGKDAQAESMDKIDLILPEVLACPVAREALLAREGLAQKLLALSGDRLDKSGICLAALVGDSRAEKEGRKLLSYRSKPEINIGVWITVQMRSVALQNVVSQLLDNRNTPDPGQMQLLIVACRERRLNSLSTEIAEFAVRHSSEREFAECLLASLDYLSAFRNVHRIRVAEQLKAYRYSNEVREKALTMLGANE